MYTKYQIVVFKQKVFCTWKNHIVVAVLRLENKRQNMYLFNIIFSIETKSKRLNSLGRKSRVASINEKCHYHHPLGQDPEQYGAHMLHPPECSGSIVD